MDEKRLYVGTYSDESIIEFLKKNKPSGFNLYETKLNDSDPENTYMENVFLGDGVIKVKFIDSGVIKDCFNLFFANNLNDATRMAKEMDLKNFSLVSNKIYQKGVDY